MAQDGCTKRPATDAEILHWFRNHRASFTHWVVELYRPRAKRGVAHKQRSCAKVQDIDGVPHVQYKGRLHRLKATWYERDGFAFVIDATIK